MTAPQRELARHALGLPNKKNTTTRNRFVTGKGSTDHPYWNEMVANGDALVWRDLKDFGGMDFFVLTVQGALEARAPREHISREDMHEMREREARYASQAKVKENQGEPQNSNDNGR